MTKNSVSYQKYVTIHEATYNKSWTTFLLKDRNIKHLQLWKKNYLILVVLFLIFNAKHNYAQDYGQVYVYITSDYASDDNLTNQYLAVMGQPQ